MSVEDRKPKINVKKVEQWLSKQQISNECPFCKNPSWSAVNGPDFVGCAMPFGDGRGDMYMSGVPVLPLICKKCKFVRTIALTDDFLQEVLEPDADENL